jgi:hypothetical protein
VKCRHSIFIKKLILKLFIKFEFKLNKQARRRRRGESLPGTGFAKPVASVFGQCGHSAAQALVQRFRRIFQRFRTFQKLRIKVRSIRDSRISLFLSGDFQDSPTHPPLVDIKILSVVLWVLWLARNKMAIEGIFVQNRTEVLQKICVFSEMEAEVETC